LLIRGLTRHVVTGGTFGHESHDSLDWSKDLATLKVVKLAEDGTPIEKAAMAYFGKRCYPTFLPDGTPGSCQSFVSTAPPTTSSTPPTGFVLNGLPLGSQPGAPFADPAVDDSGNAISINPVTHKQRLRVYKAAAIQQDVTLNKKGWHSPQQRIMTLISLSDADRSVSQPDRYRAWF
jgi:manganese oxidase